MINLTYPLEPKIYPINQKCASHNQEHQFPGMNIMINNIHSFNAHLPVSPARNIITSQQNYPNILRSRVAGGVSQELHRHKNKKELSIVEFKQVHSARDRSLHQQDYNTGK